MAKKIVQDVLPPVRRTIRDIPLPGSKPKRKSVVSEIKPNLQPKPAPKITIPEEPKRRNYNRIGIWLIAILCVVGLAYALSFIFTSATVLITPKSQNISVNSTFNAYKSPAEGSLTYTTVSVSSEGSKAVPSKGEEKAEIKASGRIVIYNNFSTVPQTLVKNTRFETPNGLIFRISEEIKIPGYTKTNSIIIPGSVKATVTADQPGEKYNVGLSDFTIPGFKGTSKYQSITAKTDPTARIGGGFSGIIKKVSEADRLSAKKDIELALKKDLLELARTQIPNTHILYENMVSFSFEQLPQESNSENSATIREKGTIFGIIFDRDELTKSIANKDDITQGALESSVATNLDALSVVFKNQSEFISKKTDVVSVSLDGSLRLEANARNTNAQGLTLEERLAGKKRSEIKGILSEFGSIDKAEIVIKPFWSLSFPKSSNKITIKVLKPL